MGIKAPGQSELALGPFGFHGDEVLPILALNFCLCLPSHCDYRLLHPAKPVLKSSPITFLKLILKSLYFQFLHRSKEEYPCCTWEPSPECLRRNQHAVNLDRPHYRGCRLQPRVQSFAPSTWLNKSFEGGCRDAIYF